MSDHDYNCGDLLDAMRAAVGEILQRHGATSPSSQSMRAAWLANELRRRQEGMPLCRDLITYRRDAERLERFLAVHRVVTICEHRARDPKLDPFGL